METQKQRWRKSELERERRREQQLEEEEFWDSKFLYEKKDKDTQREIENKYERQKDEEVIIEM